MFTVNFQNISLKTSDLLSTQDGDVKTTHEVDSGGGGGYSEYTWLGGGLLEVYNVNPQKIHKPDILHHKIPGIKNSYAKNTRLKYLNIDLFNHLFNFFIIFF